MPAASASRAASRFSGHPAFQRSGAVVPTEPEQFMPNKPSLNRLPFCIRVWRAAAAPVERSSCDISPTLTEPTKTDNHHGGIASLRYANLLDDRLPNVALGAHEIRKLPRGHGTSVVAKLFDLLDELRTRQHRSQIAIDFLHNVRWCALRRDQDGPAGRHEARNGFRHRWDIGIVRQPGG